MLLAGDEFGNGQRGNNNAYCQSNDIGWLNWPAPDSVDAERQRGFVQKLIALRAAYPILRHPFWHTDKRSKSMAGHTSANPIVLTWLSAAGAPMSSAEWNSSDFLGVLLKDVERPETCLLLFNAGDKEVTFPLPPSEWRVLLDSSVDDGGPMTQTATTVAKVLARTVMFAISIIDPRNNQELS